MVSGNRIGRLLRAGSGMALALLAAAPALAAEPRMALVVGNADYAARRLANPVNDARSLASSLNELGFKVTLVEDSDGPGMQRLVEAIRSGFGKDGIGLFYYAGHALQYKGRNYLLPVDFRLKKAADLAGVALPVDRILDAMHQAGVKIAILVLDACRDNPFGVAEDALGPGLAVVEQGQGETLIAYATAAGAVARDGAGPNSPYTAALVSALERSGMTLEEVFRDVRARVREATGGRQLPWVSGSLETALVLRAKGELAGPVEVAAAPGTASALPAGISLASVHWHTIEPSRDPADFRAFLDVQQESPFAPAAQQRLATLSRQELGSLPQVNVARALSLPDTRDGARALVTDCDIVASDNLDHARLSPPIRRGLVNTRLALRVCALDLARDAGNPRLQFLLARTLEIAERYDEAVAFYRHAADGGYARAMVSLGQMYDNGRGVAKDHQESARLYRRAALQGDPGGRVSIGRLYLLGWGVEKNEAEGVYWTELAASTGWPGAVNALGNIYERGQAGTKDEVGAFRQYGIAAQLGSVEAMNSMGRLYEEGRGVKQDLKAAVQWYERAVEEGDRFAARRLGQLYQYGKGVKADPKRALELYRLSAERGFLAAFADIGQMYEQGRGVPKDPERAYYNYRLAALGIDKKGAQEAARLEAALQPQALERQKRAIEDWREANLYAPGTGEPSL